MQGLLSGYHRPAAPGVTAPGGALGSNPYFTSTIRRLAENAPAVSRQK
jgi:hypothetical protein